jgi:pimeloyl-ACP methyl ester carboxylesterase
MAGEKQTIAIGTCRIGLHRLGRGAPVLILHGGGGPAPWLPLSERLAESHEVLLPEHPGFGESDQPDWLSTVSDLAYFYLDFIDQLRLGPVDIVGHSLGGWIAAEMAIRCPHPLRTLTLVAAAGIEVAGVERGDNFLWSPGELMSRLYHDPGVAAASLGRFLEQDEQLTWLRNQRILARLVWSPRWNNPELKKWLCRIRIPTRIVWGERDQLFPPAYGRAYAALIRDARLTVFPDCGHVPHVEQAAAFESVLRAALVH